MTPTIQPRPKPTPKRSLVVPVKVDGVHTAIRRPRHAHGWQGCGIRIRLRYAAQGSVHQIWFRPGRSQDASEEIKKHGAGEDCIAVENHPLDDGGGVFFLPGLVWWWGDEFRERFFDFLPVITVHVWCGSTEPLVVQAPLHVEDARVLVKDDSAKTGRAVVYGQNRPTRSVLFLVPLWWRRFVVIVVVAANEAVVFGAVQVAYRLGEGQLGAVRDASAAASLVGLAEADGLEGFGDDGSLGLELGGIWDDNVGEAEGGSQVGGDGGLQASEERLGGGKIRVPLRIWAKWEEIGEM